MYKENDRSINETKEKKSNVYTIFPNLFETYISYSRDIVIMVKT